VQRIAVLLPSTFDSAGEYFADIAALDAAGAHCLCVEAAGPGDWVLLGAIAAASHRAAVGVLKVGDVPADSLATLERVSRGRAMVFERGESARHLAVQGAEPPQIFHEVAVPADRAAWSESLAAAEAAGAAGVVVPWDPRLIDLLRNPAADEDRSDLLMSTG